MLNVYTSAQIEQLKRDAKRLAHNRSITHAAALDHIAAICDYKNWSLLMKHAASHPTNGTASQPKRLSYPFLRTAEAMRQAMRKTTPTLGYGSLHNSLRAQLEDLSVQFISAENALDFAISYMECALNVPRFKVNNLSFAYYEMRCWLPYCVHIVDGNLYILLGRDYKPIGMAQKTERVDYVTFPQVHLHITGHELRHQVTANREHSAEGYLYDGPPWTSRADAQTYLIHLKKLQNWLSSRSN